MITLSFKQFNLKQVLYTLARANRLASDGFDVQLLVQDEHQEEILRGMLHEEVKERITFRCLN